MDKFLRTRLELCYYSRDQNRSQPVAPNHNLVSPRCDYLFARSRQAPCCFRRLPQPFRKSGATRIHIRNPTLNRSADLLKPYLASLPRSELSLLVPPIQQSSPVPVLDIVVDHTASYLTALLGRIGLSFQISGARDSKAAPLLTMLASSVCLPPTSVVATGSHFSYSDAPYIPVQLLA